jgi:hypothetical protein
VQNSTYVSNYVRTFYNYVSVSCTRIINQRGRNPPTSWWTKKNQESSFLPSMTFSMAKRLLSYKNFYFWIFILQNYYTLYAYYVYDCYHNVTVPCIGTIKRVGEKIFQLTREKFSNLQEINPATSRGRNPPTGWEDK